MKQQREPRAPSLFNEKTGTDCPLFLNISPNHLFSSHKEPRVVKNRLVFQIRNTSLTQSVELYNDEEREYSDFKNIDEAEIRPGLSMIYLVFLLGETETCLTTEAQFSFAQTYRQENFLVSRSYPGHLILYPEKTLSIPPCGQIELVLDELSTNLPAGSITSCEAKFINIQQDIFYFCLPVYKKSIPLGIRQFEIVEGTGKAGFRDTVKFKYMAWGADTCLITPGDIVLEQKAKEEDNIYETILLKKTLFTLIARCEDEQISQSLEIKPLRAEIVNFKVSATPKGSNYEATLTFTVKNTRHVFITHAGRIKVEDGKEHVLTLLQSKAKEKYTLTVENEDGLLTESRST